MPRHSWEQVRDKSGSPVKGFFVYTGTGEIWVRKTFRKLGIPDLRENTGERTLGRARVAAELIIQRYRNRHLGISDSHVFGKDRIVSFKSVADRVLSEVTPIRRAGTQAMHQRYIPELVAEFGHEDVEAITPERFYAWVDKQKKRRQRKTYFDYAKHLNLVLNFAHARGYRKSPFMVDVKERHRVGRVLSRREIRALWTVMGERLKDQFVLSYECFMRKREALYLTWSRIDLKTGELTLRKEDVKTGTKTGKGRSFIISKNALTRLKARRSRSTKASVYVFPSRFDTTKPQHDNKTAWRLAKAAAKIKGRATWHDIRHTALSEALLDHNANIAALSEYAGVSIKTLQRTYLHADPEKLRSISEVLSVSEE